MAATEGSQIRTLAFGDVDGGIWGAALDAGAQSLVLGDRSGETSARRLEAGWSSDGPRWRLTTEGVDLHVDPGGEELDGSPRERATVTGFQELCRVHGTVMLAGAERGLDCVGTRCEIDGLDAGALGSARAVAGWFADDEAFMLLALRRLGKVGQESDLVAATLFDPDGWVPVDDPRLSTTYAGSGWPTRASLELWVGEGENEFPRRAAGEASAGGAECKLDGCDLRAVPLRCHSRGREGAGIYVLATFA